MERARVVVVEDEGSVRRSVEAALAHEGLAVAAFGDRVDAAAIEATMPDLVILDVGLPGGDGFELARQLHIVRPVIVFVWPVDPIAARTSPA